MRYSHYYIHIFSLPKLSFMSTEVNSHWSTYLWRASQHWNLLLFRPQLRPCLLPQPPHLNYPTPRPTTLLCPAVLLYLLRGSYHHLKWPPWFSAGRRAQWIRAWTRTQLILQRPGLLALLLPSFLCSRVFICKMGRYNNNPAWEPSKWLSGIEEIHGKSGT